MFFSLNSSKFLSIFERNHKTHAYQDTDICSQAKYTQTEYSQTFYWYENQVKQKEITWNSSKKKWFGLKDIQNYSIGDTYVTCEKMTSKMAWKHEF